MSDEGNHGHGHTDIGDTLGPVEGFAHREETARQHLEQGAHRIAAMFHPAPKENDVTKAAQMASLASDLNGNQLLTELLEENIGTQLAPHERAAVITLARTLEDAHKPAVTP